MFQPHGLRQLRRYASRPQAIQLPSALFDERQDPSFILGRVDEARRIERCTAIDFAYKRWGSRVESAIDKIGSARPKRNRRRYWDR